MIRFFRRKDIPEPLSPDQADALLGKIMTDLELEKPPRPGKKTYYHIVRRRYLVKRAAAAACILLILACFGPGTVVPVAVSQVSAAPSSDSASVQISFQLGSVIPVREVTAEINDHALTVESDGYQQYTVTVEENGYLLLDVCSITGIHTSHGMEISGIDTRAPEVTSHRQEGNQILIYLTDGDGVGIDFPSITAYDESASVSIPPVWYDEASGCVAFARPSSRILITVPDYNDNRLILSLAPMTGNDND